jgi:hypothetical protein
LPRSPDGSQRRAVYRGAAPRAAPGPAANPGNTQCAIVDGGEVECWGWNAYEPAGASQTPSTNAPASVFAAAASKLPLADVVDLAPDRGMQAMCAATSAGALLCWGHPFPPVGTPDATSPFPIAIPLAGGAPLRLPLSAYGDATARSSTSTRTASSRSRRALTRSPRSRRATALRRLTQRRNATPALRSTLNVKVGAATWVSSASTSAKLWARS